MGILAFKDDTRKRIYDALKQMMPRLGARKITLQTYSSSVRCLSGDEGLVFDQPDTITVLNIQSCKGLEFDAVFILDFHESNISIYGTDRFRMQLFVGVSRGRDWVQFIETGSKAVYQVHLREFPGEELISRDIRRQSSQVHDISQESHLPNKVAETPSKELFATRDTPTKNVIPANWAETARSIARDQGGRVFDNRYLDGAFWVIGSKRLAQDLTPLGFKYSETKKGWWKK